MAKAIWNDTVLAESSETIVVEGNHYFPPEAVNRQYFRDSDHQSTCPWKGLASYYHIEAEGLSNENAAWTYPEPKDAAKNITNYVAFWKGVRVEEI